jgi:hypothetical protein
MPAHAVPIDVKEKPRLWWTGLTDLKLTKTSMVFFKRVSHRQNPLEHQLGLGIGQGVKLVCQHGLVLSRNEFAEGFWKFGFAHYVRNSSVAKLGHNRLFFW